MTTSDLQADSARRPGGTLGTFAGVFTPSILTILGIILFLRVGFVVGAAGLPRALLILLLANAISVLTSLSLSAIATNLRVRGGGDYYLISRTLGAAYGGAIGLVLFLAQAISIAFYAIGFGEAIAALGGAAAGAKPPLVAAIAVAALFVLAWLGADWATRFQYVVMLVLTAALVAFFAGGVGDFSLEQLGANTAPATDMTFWALFAIFFPAVTGFTQGVSMSGDLADPGKSLPRGTFAAVGLSFAVYLGAALVFAGSLPAATLVDDPSAMRRISAVGWLVDAGVIAATLSSAMASFLGAPRILQSLASDRIFGFLVPFAAGHGPTNNPRRGVALAGAIALATILLGNLNAIAAIVSMFFLVSYGLLNYATYFEARANSPSFRPRFRYFSAHLSLAGAGACLVAMIAISPTAGVIAVAVLMALYQYVARSASGARWADSAGSHRLQRVRADLLALEGRTRHARDWRPVILAFSDDPARRQRMLHFASWIEGGAGFTTIVRFLPADDPAARRRRDEIEREIGREIRELELDAFVRGVICDDVERTMSALLQSFGVGRVRPNTVLLNWYDRSDADGAPGLRGYLDYVRTPLRHDCSVVLLAAGEQDFAAVESVPPAERRIDVWFRDNASGALMILLAYLLTRDETWEEAGIRLLVPVGPHDDTEATRERLAELLDSVRIDAEIETVTDLSPEVVVERSRDSALVFLPFRLEAGEPVGVFGGPLDETVRGLGITALVLGSRAVALDPHPESGAHGALAAAQDRAAELARVSKAAEAEAEEAAKHVVALGERARQESEKEAAAEGGAAAEELRVAEEELDRLRRRAARTRAKSDAAARAAAELEDAPQASVSPLGSRDPD